MPLKMGRIELHVGPRAAGAPDDLGDVIVRFISGAKRSLDIAVQELDSRRIARAIVAAKHRGVAVRVVLEADYLRAARAAEDPWLPGGGNEPNRAVHHALLRAAIDVRTDTNPAIFHHKFVVRDRSAVLLGSTNFTETGITKNLNHVLIVEDASVARLFATEFLSLARGEFGRESPRRPPPRDLDVSGVRIRVAFAPDHNPEMEIMKQMLEARRRIELAMFTFAQSSGIDDVMIELTRHGIPVVGALDGMQVNQKWAATRPVKNAGAELHTVPKSDVVGKLHHKLLVLDRELIIAGSFNYTGPATRLNDESVIVVGDLAATTTRAKKRQAKIARFASGEIQRIVRVHGRGLG